MSVSDCSAAQCHAMSDALQFLDYASKLTGSGVLLLGLWALVSGKIRHAREVEAVEKQLAKSEQESERWEKMALRGMNIATTATSIAATATSPPPPPPGN